jgi:hypothetical protein
MTKKEFIKRTKALLKKGERPEYFIMANTFLFHNYEETIQLEKQPYVFTFSVPYAYNHKEKRIGLIFTSNDFNRTLSFWRDILKLTVQDIKRTVRYAE